MKRKGIFSGAEELLNPNAARDNLAISEEVFSMDKEKCQSVIDQIKSVFAELQEQSNDKYGEYSWERVYQKEIGKFPKELSLRESLVLARLKEEGNPEAEEFLTCAYLRLAWAIACKLSVKYSTLGSLDLMDFVGAANLGLTDAEKKWESAKQKGARFETYARYRIVGQILDQVRSMGSSAFKVNRDIVNLKEKVSFLLECWEKNSAPSLEDLSKLTGAGRTSIERVLVESCLVSADWNFDFMGMEAGLEYSGVSIDDVLDIEQELVIIQEKIEGCKDKQILLWALGFLPGDGKNKTMKQIGSMFGRTESRVSQIVKEFLLYLKEKGLVFTRNEIIRKQEFVLEARLS